MLLIFVDFWDTESESDFDLITTGRSGNQVKHNTGGVGGGGESKDDDDFDFDFYD